MSYVMHLVSLLAIGVTWLATMRIALRWCTRCGVGERTSRWALACILPTTGLIVSVHTMALASMIAGRGLVLPESIAAVFLITALLFHRFVNARPDPDEKAPDPPFKLGIGWLPLLVVAGMYLIFLLDALVRYPIGYDALYYHLPKAVGWMQQRDLSFIPGFVYLAMPENGMIVPLLLSFAKLEAWFVLVNLPTALLVAAAVFGLTRALSVSRAGAWISVCIALSVPIVVFQSFSTYIDLYATAAWLTALLALTWVTRVQHKWQRRNLLILAGLAAGIALGSKTTFLVTVALLSLVAMGTEWIRPSTRFRDRRHPWHSLGLFVVGSLVCSGFWFVRATVQTGNPVYPLAVHIGDREILPGFTGEDFARRRPLTAKLQRWWNYHWRETKYSGTGYPYSVNNGFGAAYATFVPVGLIAAIGVFRRRFPFAGTQPPAKWFLVFFGLSLTGAVLLLTVFREMLRFVLPQVLWLSPILS